MRANSEKAVGQRDLDAIIDCAGATEMMELAFSLLGISGHYANVGLVGERISVPLLPRVNREQTFHGSYWGNNVDLDGSAGAGCPGQGSPPSKLFKFEQINEYLDLMRAGDIVGRAVMKW